MRATIFTFACLFMIAACSDDDDTTTDGQVMQDQGVVSEQGTTDDQGTTEDQSATLESKGGCDMDVEGKKSCVDYVGTKYEEEATLNTSKNACTTANGTWVDAGCATDEFQGYCTWFEGSSTEHRFYYYNYSTEDLATVKTECEEATDKTWHDA